MIKKIVLGIVLSLISSNVIVAQRNVKDSSIFMPLVSIDYGALFPSGDYANRFGFTNALGLTIDFKTKKNLIYGIHSNFLFGNQVRQTKQFESLVNSDGTVSTLAGGIAAVSLKMRGFNVNLDLGYLITFSKPNPNSGIFLKFGAGFLHNKIHIQNVEQDVPQLNGQYRAGYDMLSYGANISQHIGYQYIHNKGVWNFHFGFYVIEGFTQNVRYNFLTKSKDNSTQFDVIYGFKLGWIIPIYRRTADRYYYN